MNSCHEEG
eukprot:gene26022-biopygen17910